MAGKKFIRRASTGELIEVKGIQSAGTAGEAGDIIALDSNGRINENMMPTGVGADVETMPESEVLSAGNLVNIWDDTGVRKARKADASNSRRAHGFVKAAADEGNVDVYLSGVNDAVTVGAGDVESPAYLATAGGFSTTAPTTASHISQEVGIVVGANKISFLNGRPITLA